MKARGSIVFVILALTTAGSAYGSSVTRSVQASPAFKILMNDVKSNLILQKTTGSATCPSFVMLQDSPAQLEFSKPGDRQIDLSTFIPAIRSNGSFQSTDVNRLYLRPGLTPGVVHVLNRDIKFDFGVGYSVFKQAEMNGVLVAERSAYYLSPGVIGRNTQRISFNAHTHEVKYHFEANGVAPTDCVFAK